MKNTQIESKIAISHSQLPQNGYRSDVAMLYNPKTKEYEGISVGSNGIDQLSHLKSTSLSLQNNRNSYQNLKQIKGINACQWIENTLWIQRTSHQVSKELTFP